MNKTNSLTKMFLATILAFAMLISGMALVLSQKTNMVYAADETPTALQQSFDGSVVNFYPVFANSNKPSGTTFYTKSGNTYTEIENPTMTSINEALNSPIYSDDTTLYFAGGKVKCFAVVQLTWGNVFNGNSLQNNVAQGLNSNFSNKLNTAGFITPYFNPTGWNCSNWNDNSMAPTINGVSIGDIVSAYSFSNTALTNYVFWSSKVEDLDFAYGYNGNTEMWFSSPKFDPSNAVLLCEFGASYSVTYNLNEGSGTAPTTSTKYSVGDSITLPDGTGLSKTDKVFLGWSTNQDATIGNIGSYTIKESDVVSNAITFYAVWGQNQATVTANSTEEFWQLNNSLVLPTADITGLSFTCGKMENNAFVVYTKISASDGKLIYSNDKTSLEVYDSNAQEKWSYGIQQIIFRSPITENSPLHIWLTANASKQYTYITDDGSELLCNTYEFITSSSTSLGATSETKWYVVDSDVTISSRIACVGAVNLILLNGKTLTASKGISVSGSGNSLTIYGQSGNTGALVANADSYCAGIGGGNKLSNETYSGGNITINGGTITATGKNGSAGIGGGNSGSGSNITINGGIVNATGGTQAAGIGGGYTLNGSTTGSNITINGGTITAIGNYGGAGIGGSEYCCGNNITINGGVVTATGGFASSSVIGNGIGNGHGCTTAASNIYIGDAVTAKAGTSSTFTDSDIIAHPRTNDQLTDVASSFSGKQYVVTTQKYQIAYYDNCSDTVSNTPSDDTYYEVGADVTISTATPTRTGYTFLGWATSSDGEVISDKTLEMEEGGISLFAKWQQDSSGGSPNTGIYFGGSEALIFSCLALIALGVFVVLSVSKKKEN